MDDISWLLERAKNAERMEWALNILKGRTEFHKEGQQYNYIAKQGLGEEPSPLDRKIKP